MHICASKLTIIGSDNGLSPGRHPDIIWTMRKYCEIQWNFNGNHWRKYVWICRLRNVVHFVSASMLFSASCCEQVFHCRIVACIHMCYTYVQMTYALQWRHNGHNDVSNHQRHHCLFTQPFIQAQIKENIKAPRHWPLCGEFTGHRWIPRTNGQ